LVESIGGFVVSVGVGDGDGAGDTEVSVGVGAGVGAAVVSRIAVSDIVRPEAVSARMVLPVAVSDEPPRVEAQAMAPAKSAARASGR
jgi:hypothetical protein